MSSYCTECGNEMEIDQNGISNHLVDGEIDYDADADHVALAESDC
jgi:hypothetical protein